MRCDQCNKFVSFDTDTDPEVNVSVDESGVVTGDVRITNNCAECGQELKESTFTVDVDLSDAVTAHRDGFAKGAHVLDVDMSDISRTDRRVTTDRRGKPIRNSRYQKQMYGAEGTIIVTCGCDANWSTSIPWSGEVQGSGMEELV